MRVGTRYPSMMHSQSGKDHPHACGDKLSLPFLNTFIGGSSPCVWGQGFMNGSENKSDGIIPMRVGTSRACNNLRHPCRDHPHACGDKICRFRKPTLSTGSSPCVWGQVLLCYLFGRVTRIIPMRVGTSSNRKSYKS